MMLNSCWNNIVFCHKNTKSEYCIYLILTCTFFPGKYHWITWVLESSMKMKLCQELLIIIGITKWWLGISRASICTDITCRSRGYRRALQTSEVSHQQGLNVDLADLEASVAKICRVHHNVAPPRPHKRWPWAQRQWQSPPHVRLMFLKVVCRIGGSRHTGFLPASRLGKVSTGWRRASFQENKVAGRSMPRCRTLHDGWTMHDARSRGPWSTRSSRSAEFQIPRTVPRIKCSGLLRSGKKASESDDEWWQFLLARWGKVSEETAPFTASLH